MKRASAALPLSFSLFLSPARGQIYFEEVLKIKIDRAQLRGSVLGSFCGCCALNFPI